MPKRYEAIRDKFMKQGMPEKAAKTKAAKIAWRSSRNQEEMKACPFCGFAGPLIIYRGLSMFAIHCPQCGGSGPFSLTEKGAKDWWNTREGINDRQTSPLDDCEDS